jgi:hypothetical protein
MSKYFPIGFSFQDEKGFVLLVAAGALAVLGLARYWSRLKDRPARARGALVTLRGVALWLAACALSGAGIDYATEAPQRVALRLASDLAVGPGHDASERAEKIRRQVLAALRERQIGVVELGTRPVDRGQGSGRFIAAVLLTDGALEAGAARRSIEGTSVAAGGAPVYVLTGGWPEDGPAAALETVRIAGEPVRGVPVAVQCVVRGRGMRGRESLVVISDSAKIETSARIRWSSDDEQQTTTLEIVPKTAGWLDYTARVEPIGDQATTSDLAPSVPFSLYAGERRWRVLFFEGQPTWEGKFIRRALEESDLFDVDYFAQVSRAAGAGQISTVGERSRAREQTPERDESTGPERNRARQHNASRAVAPGAAGSPERSQSSDPLARLRETLRNAANLAAYDCIIVGATPDEMLSQADAARLAEWVRRRGGGLIVLGGNGFAGSIAAPGGRLYKLLPSEARVENAGEGPKIGRGVPLEAEPERRAVRLVPTPEGAAGPLRGFADAAERSADSALTGEGLALGALRPGAVALAEAGSAQGTRRRIENAPLIAARADGAGRTLIFGPADSWRLKLSSADAPEASAFDALWQGLVLWAAAGARPPAELVLDDESPAAGDHVTAEIRARDTSFAPQRIEQVSALLRPVAEEDSALLLPAKEVDFSPDARSASIWRARFTARVPGRYTLEVDYTAGHQQTHLEKRFAIVRSPVAARRVSEDGLCRAARETGGDAYAEVGALVEHLASEARRGQTERRTLELRSWWALALIIPALLSTEWFLRRRWGVD